MGAPVVNRRLKPYNIPRSIPTGGKVLVRKRIKPWPTNTAQSWGQFTVRAQDKRRDLALNAAQPFEAGPQQKGNRWVRHPRGPRSFKQRSATGGRYLKDEEIEWDRSEFEPRFEDSDPSALSPVFKTKF